MKRTLEGQLSNEAKREVLTTMKETKSLDYTLGVLRELHGELEKEIGSLEAKFGEEIFSLRLLLKMLNCQLLAGSIIVNPMPPWHYWHHLSHCN